MGLLLWRRDGGWERGGGGSEQRPACLSSAQRPSKQLEQPPRSPAWPPLHHQYTVCPSVDSILPHSVLCVLCSHRWACTLLHSYAPSRAKIFKVFSRDLCNAIRGRPQRYGYQTPLALCKDGWSSFKVKPQHTSAAALPIICSRFIRLGGT